jgi:Endomembrane protein 70
MHLVLIGIQNRMLCPYLTVIHRILISVMRRLLVFTLTRPAGIQRPVPFAICPSVHVAVIRLCSALHLLGLSMPRHSHGCSFCACVCPSVRASLLDVNAPQSRGQDDPDDLESLERDISEESGWKLVHGDVFRPPKGLEILAALIGTGAKLWEGLGFRVRSCGRGGSLECSCEPSRALGILLWAAN